MVLLHYILQLTGILTLAGMLYFLYHSLNNFYVRHKHFKVEMEELQEKVKHTTPQKDAALKERYKDFPIALEIIGNAEKNRQVRLYSVNSVEKYTTTSQTEDNSVVSLNPETTTQNMRKISTEKPLAKILSFGDPT